ncbi:MAG TPA: hypothetical protein PKZ84_12680 [Anaerolineae bacterium]|nr:hypothetical protein [Anaerolineae bacterium]HQI85681.1 hypothetical protein [Anaerolineae bacterium]
MIDEENATLRPDFVAALKRSLEQAQKGEGIDPETFRLKKERYETFKREVQTNERFLATLETQNPLWEQDAMECEYWLEEQQAWCDYLETIKTHKSNDS